MAPGPNHTVIAKENVRNDPDEPFYWGESHIFGKCAGCDAFTYGIESWTEDDLDPETNQASTSWKTYPQGEGQRKGMDDAFTEFPTKVHLIYSEVMGAFNAQLHILTGIGLRALIEAICLSQKIPGNNLEKRIDALATKGVLSSREAEFLHGLRFLGNVAAHEIVSAQRPELAAALDVAESILRTIYVLPGLSTKVKTGRKPKGNLPE